MQMLYESTGKGPNPETIQRITLAQGNYKVTCGGAKGGAGNGDKSKPACIGGFGATVSGYITLNKSQDFLIATGNPGTDNTGTSGDGSSGGGGGGTYFTKIVDEDYPGAVITSGFTNEEFNSLYVIPILVAAGGNGGRDYGYSGDGTVYHGVHTTHSSYISGARPGGCFYSTTPKSIYNGSNFVDGAKGATYYYTRNGTSMAGFGGGAANQDDREGGGGGGYYGGHATLAACSYSHPELVTDFSGSTGTSENGYIEIKQMELLGPYETSGTIVIPLSEFIPSNGANSLIISDIRRIPQGTSIQGDIKLGNSDWAHFVPGETIDIKGVKEIQIRYIFDTSNIMSTPTISDISIKVTLPQNKQQLIIHINNANKFHNAINEVHILYDGSVDISDTYGVAVDSFSASFVPINVVKKDNPSVKEYVMRSSTPGTFSYQHINTIEGESDPVSVNIVTRTSYVGTFSVTKIENVNP